MSRRPLASALALAALLALGPSGPASAAPLLPTANVSAQMTDFSQHQNPGWQNYCAPTAAANLAYHLSLTFADPALRQNNAFGPPVGPPPPPNEDDDASNVIGGASPGAPPPPAGSLADLMSTDLLNGTTTANLTQGLDTYLENNDSNGGQNFWTTQFFLASDPGVGGGSGLFDIAADSLAAGAGVILLIDWRMGDPVLNPPPPGINTGPTFGGETADQLSHMYDEPQAPGTGANDPIGHAVTLVGYDVGAGDLLYNDPGNNLNAGAGQHNWLTYAGRTEVSTFSLRATDIQINVQGTQGFVYGIVTTIPEPGTAALLGLALGGLAALRRRETR
jgi:hypothetical protein